MDCVPCGRNRTGLLEMEVCVCSSSGPLEPAVLVNVNEKEPPPILPILICSCVRNICFIKYKSSVKCKVLYNRKVNSRKKLLIV